tara:strand:+ start:1239 stop:2069 length:831 start_codon:yes stop_codon:yes gene_type:complete
MKKRISFQGKHGAYSDLACKKFFPALETLPCDTFEEALSAVKNDFTNLALIPVENNIAGRVADMHFLLEDIDLKIVAEHYFKIQHHLLGLHITSISKIRKVYSHVHALSQCKKNLEKLALQPVSYLDTAGAAEFVSKSNDATIAAISSKLASDIYNLKILKKNISDHVNNITRFLVFAKKSVAVGIEKRVITTIVFNTKNSPAALYKALGGFALNNINLTRLESFFVNKDFKQFSFLIDVECHPDKSNFLKALNTLKNSSTRVKIIGFYEASGFRK